MDRSKVLKNSLKIINSINSFLSRRASWRASYITAWHDISTVANHSDSPRRSLVLPVWMQPNGGVSLLPDHITILERFWRGHLYVVSHGKKESQIGCQIPDTDCPWHTNFLTLHFFSAWCGHTGYLIALYDTELQCLRTYFHRIH